MSAAEPPHRYRSFVALGDSFTEGLQDDLGPAGRHRGWADRVAAALAVTAVGVGGGVEQRGGLRYANLAVRGRLLDAVVREQVPVAEALAPDLVSFQAAGNDLLRPRVDLPGVLARYEQGVERLRAAGADVLLFTVVGRTGGSGRTADLLDTRFGAFNAHVRDVAARHGCALADLGGARALQDRRFWHEDRLHLGPSGHERVAAAACEALGLTGDAVLGGPPGWWRDPLPVRPPAGRRADLVDDVRWVRRHFLPWVSRRLRGVSSGDGLSPETSRAHRRAAADTPGVKSAPGASGRADQRRRRTSRQEYRVWFAPRARTWQHHGARSTIGEDCVRQDHEHEKCRIPAPPRCGRAGRGPRAGPLGLR